MIMAPLEVHTNLNAAASDSETQPPAGGEFENEISDENELEYVQVSVPFDDIIGFGEVFDTEEVDPEHEIPVVDLGGSVHSGFTSIRDASIQASGMTAHKMAIRRAHVKPYSLKSDCSPMKQHAAEHNLISDDRDVHNSGKEMNKEHDQEGYNEQVKDLMSESRFNICNSIDRRLSTVDECKQPDGGLNASRVALNFPQLFDFEDRMGDLSYIESQEPGESSQANALDFVDRFLKVNVIECDQDVDIRRSTGGKSKASSSAKGSRSLVKTVIFGNDRNCGIFDWDDRCEDEGGGEFYGKKMDLFLHNVGQTRKSTTHPRKVRCIDSSNIKAVEDCRDEEEEHLDIMKKFENLVCSDLSIVLRETRGSIKSSKLTGKTEMEIDEQPDEPQILLIGSDTHMAAEAMETSCFGVDLPDKGRRKTGEGANNMHKDHHKAETKTRVHTKQSFLLKEAYPSKAGSCSRQSKKTKRNCAEVSREVSLSSAQSRNVRKQYDLEAVKAHGTGQCREVNQTTSAGKDLNDSRDEMNDLVGVVSHRKRSKLDANASETSRSKDNADHALELRNAKSVCNERSDFKGRRTHIKLPLNSQEAKTRYNTRSNRLKTDSTCTTMNVNNVISAYKTKRSNKKSNAKVKAFAENAEATGRADMSPRDGYQSSALSCRTPVNCRSPVNVASPICMADEYHKQSCKKRDMRGVRVLFSNHLDADIIKHQKKILKLLGASKVSSISHATHFIADEFVRTKNMLEAIAFGKPVVTHLWLESCGQATCLIDERNFILRDVRKEKQFGFSMPASLARAGQRPLLQGQRVLITRYTKPAKEIVASLVKAVSGVVVGRLGRSTLRGEKLPDDLLVLSCEEDYKICIPFLEKGAAVYSSELLLDGIITQKLDYERHRLFVDHIQKTQSII